MARISSDTYCIISDLDGTLLDSQHRIPESLKSSIQAFQRSYGYLTFATGRPLESVQPYIQEADIRIPAILCNGAKLFDPIRKEYLYEAYFQQDDYQVFLDILTDCFSDDTGVFAVTDEKIYCYHVTPFVKKQADKDSVTFDVVSDIAALRELLPIKCMLMGEETRLDEWQTALGSLNTVRSEKDLLEVMPHGIDKSVGCKKLIELLQLDETKCFVVGDSLNDCDMIEAAFNGVAVQNAHAEVKRLARQVTQRTNDEGAIAELIDDIIRKNH